VHNTGTIPVKLYDQELVKVSKNATDYTLATPMHLDIGTRYYVYVGADKQEIENFAFEAAQFSFTLSAHGCDQIDPQSWATGNKVGYLDVTIHVEQAAQQKTDYDFSVEYTFANWNE
jgi:hypothetical protein